MHKLQGEIRANCEKYRAETKRNGIVESVRLIQLSTVGEVFFSHCRDRLCRVRRFQQQKFVRIF